MHMNRRRDDLVLLLLGVDVGEVAQHDDSTLLVIDGGLQVVGHLARTTSNGRLEIYPKYISSWTS